MCRLRQFLICTLCLVLFVNSRVYAATETDRPQLAVLVTGASSGLGKLIAETLAGEGYFVYAGARKEKDLKALDEIENIQSIRLDVTRQDEIDAAQKFIRAQGRGLYGLVNNAGVLFAGPNIEMSIEQVQWLFDVNVFGVLRMTNSFAPLLAESGGRIVNIGSIAGNIGIKYLGPYSMSKHALEAYTDSLAAEMALLGVRVSIVSAGDFTSNMWTAQFQKARQSGLVEKNSPFDRDVADWIASVESMKTKKPTAVVQAVNHALFDAHPRRRYLVVPDRGEAEWVTGSMVTRLAEANTDQEYAYSADELAVMLKNAMSQAGSAD